MDMANLRNDLDENLFGPSHPYACLTLWNVLDAQLVHGAVTAYGLNTKPSRHPGATHLVYGPHVAGGHKRDSVRLFFAALDVVWQKAARAAYLYQVSQLHITLACAFGQNWHPYTPDGIVQPWLDAPTLLALDVPSVIYLRQAGVSLALPKDRLDLSMRDIRRLLPVLVGERNKPLAGFSEAKYPKSHESVYPLPKSWETDCCGSLSETGITLR